MPLRSPFCTKAVSWDRPSIRVGDGGPELEEIEDDDGDGGQDLKEYTSNYSIYLVKLLNFLLCWSNVCLTKPPEGKMIFFTSRKVKLLRRLLLRF